MTVVPHPVDLRDAFFDTLHPIVSEDDSVMILTADHGAQGLTRIPGAISQPSVQRGHLRSRTW